MRFHFKLDGLNHQHRDTLLSIESAMTGLSFTAPYSRPVRRPFVTSSMMPLERSL